MLHNGGGQVGSRGENEQEQLHCPEEDNAELHRSPPKSIMKGTAFSAPRINPKGASDKSNKPYLQFSLPRPSVLRKGNQTLSHALSNLPDPGDWSKEKVCKAEHDQSSKDKNNGPTSMQCPPETHTASPQAGEIILFVKGVCRWPGCDEVCKEYSHFLKHLYSEHIPGDKATEQYKMQRKMVQDLENQLIVERQRLQAMYLHLSDRRPFAEGNPIPKQSSSSLGSLQPYQGPSLHGNNGVTDEMLRPGYWQIPTSQFISGLIPSIECYKYTNIRPPFTYACMIRWAILESPEKQRTLNEIYHWFTSMFFYFRHHTATWKNAIRHNLSLHKCFVRVDEGKGSVWTVDEEEFLRRKGQKLHRDQDLSWMAHYSMMYS